MYTHSHSLTSSWFYIISLDKPRTFWFTPLLFLLLALTVPSFFLPFFPSGATIRQSSDHSLDLQPVHEWENSYSGFWFYASLLRSPHKHRGILEKKPKNKNDFILARTLSKLCLQWHSKVANEKIQGFFFFFFLAAEAKWPWGSTGCMFPFHGVARVPSPPPAPHSAPQQ